MPAEMTHLLVGRGGVRTFRLAMFFAKGVPIQGELLKPQEFQIRCFFARDVPIEGEVAGPCPLPPESERLLGRA